MKNLKATGNIDTEDVALPRSAKNLNLQKFCPMKDCTSLALSIWKRILGMLFAIHRAKLWQFFSFLAYNAPTGVTFL